MLPQNLFFQSRFYKTLYQSFDCSKTNFRSLVKEIFIHQTLSTQLQKSLQKSHSIIISEFAGNLLISSGLNKWMNFSNGKCESWNPTFVQQSYWECWCYSLDLFKKMSLRRRNWSFTIEINYLYDHLLLRWNTNVMFRLVHLAIIWICWQRSRSRCIVLLVLHLLILLLCRKSL